MNQELSELLKRVDVTVEASFEMPTDEASQAIRDLIAALRASPGGERDDKVCYALGYCWYNLPEDSPERWAETERWLRRALELNAEQHEARLFLGYHLFDRKQYGEALQLLQGVPGGGDDPDEKWQELKTRELIACCEIRLDPDRADLKLIQSVCKAYLEATPEESVVPAELVETLAWAIGHAKRPDVKTFAADACIALMDKLGLGQDLLSEVDKELKNPRE